MIVSGNVVASPSSHSPHFEVKETIDVNVKVPEPYGGFRQATTKAIITSFQRHSLQFLQAKFDVKSLICFSKLWTACSLTDDTVSNAHHGAEASNQHLHAKEAETEAGGSVQEGTNCSVRDRE